MQKDILLIVPQNKKEQKIKEISSDKLTNIKVTTFEEIKKELFFDYDERTIYHIMKQYKVNYDLAQIYLENIYLIEDKKYDIEILDNLVNIKKYLEHNNLLIKNNFYSSFLKTKNVMIESYKEFNALEQKIIEHLKKSTNLEIKAQELYEVNNCYSFNTIFDEISFVFEQIMKLIDKGISINDIALLNVKNEYISVIKLVSQFYNMPINLQEENYLYGTTTCKKFIEKLSETKNIEEALLTIENTNLYNEFIDVCNKYIWCNDDYIIPLIKHALKNKKIPCVKYINAITINKQKKYNFLIGFNNTFPHFLKDDAYLNDEIKKKINQNMSYELNNINKKQTIYELKTIPNLIISYSLKSTTNEFSKSTLVEEMKLKINCVENFISEYSDELNKYNLIKYLDIYRKYNHVDKNLNKLYNKYKINYLSYDNKFTEIDNKELIKFLNNKLILSYTSLNNYYNCKFKYYLNDILKLNKNNDSFHLMIGNLYHYILSIAFKDDFDFDTSVNKYIESLDKKLTNKEQFFLYKLKNNLKEIIEIIKNQKKYTSLNEELYEKQIYVDKSNKVKITLMGVIDKVLYTKEKEKKYAIIIDYKTGNPNTSLDNIKYGIDMQLPMYLYLIKKEFDNIEVIGMYYQKLLHRIPNITDSTEEIRSKYKLIGYTIDREKLINKIDNTYEDSNIIKGMKKGKNGFYSYTKLLNEEKLNNMLNLVDNKIDNAIKSILECDFEINPKKIDKYTSCENCIFNNICYKTEKDIIYLNKEVI